MFVCRRDRSKRYKQRNVTDFGLCLLLLAGEIQRLKDEMELATERAERETETLQQKLTTIEKDCQTAVEQARHDCQQEITRINDSKVPRFGVKQFLYFRLASVPKNLRP